MNSTTFKDGYEPELDVHAIASRIWKYRWLVGVSVVLFSGVFAAMAFFMTPVYRASLVMLPAADQSGMGGSLGSALGSLGGLASLAGINVGGGGTQTEEALAVLRSRHFTEEFITKHNLMPDLFADRWNARAGSWNKGNAPPLAMGFKKFGKISDVVQDKKTGLITVRIDWQDPAKATAWVNSLVDMLNSEMRSRAIAGTNASTRYLQDELAATTVIDTRAMINRLMEAQINRRMLANVTQEFAFRIVDRALVPDKTDIVRPRKVVLLAGGPILGLIVGVLLAVIFGPLSALWKKSG